MALGNVARVVQQLPMHEKTYTFKLTKPAVMSDQIFLKLETKKFIVKKEKRDSLEFATVYIESNSQLRSQYVRGSATASSKQTRPDS